MAPNQSHEKYYNYIEVSNPIYQVSRSSLNSKPNWANAVMKILLHCHSQNNKDLRNESKKDRKIFLVQCAV